MQKWGRLGGIVLLIGSLLSPMPFQVANAQEVDRENFSYINLVDPNKWANYGKHIDTEAKNSKLDVVSPTFYKINNDGEETLNRTALKPELVQDMHSRNIKVVPVIQNDWNNSLTLKNIDAYVDQLASDAEAYGFDGIHIDLENIRPEYKERLTEFVEKLRNRLPVDKQVSVAVAAVPTGKQEGWQKTYDYQGIVEALTGPNDYIVIMAYDEFGTSKGPIARDSFVENSIKYAVQDLKISNKKVVLGIPLYGLIQRIEKNGTVQTAQLEHWRILGDPNNPDFVPILEKFKDKITITYDESTPVAKFTLDEDSFYKIKDNFPLKAGTYTIWYDDERSIKKKLSLVQKYDLRGAASWSLAQEYTPMWDYYNEWLNRKYDLKPPVVSPISIHTKNITGTAEIGSTVYVEYGNQKIKQATDKEGKFSIPVSRLIGDTKLKVYAIDEAGNKSEDVYVTVNRVPVTFPDLGGVTWAKEAIERMASLGIINGFADNTFKPNKNVTRAEFATLLIKTLGISGTASEPFTDVTTNDWFYYDVALAYKYNIINGKSTTLFAPNETITRQEMATMMVRAMNVKQTIQVKDINGTLKIFKDRNLIADWAKENVAIAVEQGLITGMGEGRFAPSDNATRAQAAMIMDRFYHKFMKS